MENTVIQHTFPKFDPSKKTPDRTEKPQILSKKTAVPTLCVISTTAQHCTICIKSVIFLQYLWCAAGGDASRKEPGLMALVWVGMAVFVFITLVIPGAVVLCAGTRRTVSAATTNSCDLASLNKLKQITNKLINNLKFLCDKFCGSVG